LGLCPVVPENVSGFFRDKLVDERDFENVTHNLVGIYTVSKNVPLRHTEFI
jgi:hypothetical protein